MGLEKSKALASIIINNYNYGRFLPGAIDSALNQTYHNVEVIVVDDGSTDNSREVIESYGDQLIPVLKKNGGQASAFNAGFAASKGEVVCILDSDDIFLPEKVAEVMNIFAQYPDIGWCFHSLIWADINNNTLSGGRHEAGPSRECDFRVDMREKGKLPLHTPATSALCFRHSLLQQLLPMPEGQSISIGDHYLKFMASALSKGFYLDKELTLQKVHDNNAYTDSDNKARFQARIYTLTSYWIRTNFPALKKFTNIIFIMGVSLYWQTGGIEKENKDFVEGYLSRASLTEKIEINLRIFYNYLKKRLLQA